MLSITDNFLYVIDSEGRQQLFDTDKLKSALLEAFEAAGNPNSYLAEDIACAVESAMMESMRSDRIFLQSEVDAAVSRILENAGCANAAQVFRRANSRLYIALDANLNDAKMLINRHLGISDPLADKLAAQVVGALKKLNIASASPALYLELARHYEHTLGGTIATAGTASSVVRVSGSKILLSAADAAELMPQKSRHLLDEKIIAIANVSKLYTNFQLKLDLANLADKLQLKAPVTELEIAGALYDAGEKCGMWLNILCKHLNMTEVPLYLVLTRLDVFANRYLGTTYPEGRLAALDIAGLFRNALGYPVKKVRCRTNSAN